MTMEDFTKRLRDRYPKAAAAADNKQNQDEEHLAEMIQTRQKTEAELRTRACMEGEYRKAYANGRTINEGRNAALVECASLLTPQSHR
jgi:hypothetical protein